MPEEDDPYERGFADKLYEDYDNDQDSKYVGASEPQHDISMGEQAVQQYYKKRKKHRVLRFFGKLLLSLLLIFAVLVGTLHFLAKEPKSLRPFGARKEDCCTVLLVGQDKESYNTDTILLMRLDRANRAINLMSIPRDTKVNSTYTPHKINAAFAANGGSSGREAEGMDALMDYTAQCVGFRPDSYILIDLSVFVKLVNLFGGVEFDVPQDMYYDDPSQDLHIALNEGLQTLNGEEAMGLVRFRSGYANADIGRVSVQRDFVKAAIEQWATPWNLFRLPVALGMLIKNCETDMSLLNLYWLAESALLCGTDNMYMTVMPFYFSDIYVIVNANQEYLDLINSRFNPYEREVTWEDLNIAY